MMLARCPPRAHNDAPATLLPVTSCQSIFPAHQADREQIRRLVDHGEELLARFRHWEPLISKSQHALKPFQQLHTHRAACSMCGLRQFVTKTAGMQPVRLQHAAMPPHSSTRCAVCIATRTHDDACACVHCLHAEPEFVGGTAYNVNPSQPKVGGGGPLVHSSCVPILCARVRACAQHARATSLQDARASIHVASYHVSVTRAREAEAQGRMGTAYSEKAGLLATTVSSWLCSRALQLKFTPNYDYFDELKKGDHL